MPELIRCSACNRALQLPESLMGQNVQCPFCQATFVASTPGAPAPPPSGYPAAPPGPSPSRRPYGRDDRDEYGRPDDRDEYGRPDDRDDYEEDRYRRRPRRYDAMPHRGSTVLTLGILGLVFSLCPLVGFILGLIALILGNADITAMERGEMDREGHGSTVAGRTCGLIGVILSGVFFVLGLMLRLGGGLR